MRQRNVAVFGGSGFCGSYLVLNLLKRGDCVTIFDIMKPLYDCPEAVFIKVDTRNMQSLLNISCFNLFDEVYICAGILGTSETFYHLDETIDVNIRGTVNILELCRQNNIETVVFASKPLHWLNPYSATKRCAEEFCEIYRKHYNMRVIVVRWFNVYGPRQKLIPVRKLVPTIIAQILCNKHVEIWGSGKQSMDLIYGDDMAELTIKLTRTPGINSVFEMGRGTPIRVIDVVEKLIEIIGHDIKIKHCPMRIGEEPEDICVADMRWLKDVYPNFRFTDLNEGFLETIAYYENYGLDSLIQSLDTFK